ncbi:MAG: hypothetical protein ACKV22_16695 [Bryobacteraceae bacterium]
MPIDPKNEALLAQIYRNLKEQPIDPDHPFYVKIWEGSPHDPIKRLKKHITWNEVESLQLFSGFSGSGKTTQLMRLQQELQREGYRVLYVDAEEYLNLGEAVDITALLITATGAFSDKLDPSWVRESYWERLVNYLKTTDVQISGASFKFGGAELKAELRTSPSFRQQLQKALNERLPQITAQARTFVEEVTREAAPKAGPIPFRFVFLFDSFEKLHGTPSNEQEIMASVERLFRNHLELLQLPGIHCVYSVPAWLSQVISYAEVRVIPTLKLWRKRDASQTADVADENGFAAVREILQRRFGGHDACARIFGPPDAKGQFRGAESLFAASGGALRDLLRLFRETLLQGQDLPVTSKVIDAAIAEVRNDFRVSIEDARWLAKIHQEQAADLPTSSASDVNRFTRLLDSHLLLYYRNERDWYDIHPLVREEVARIVSLNPERAAKPAE